MANHRKFYSPLRYPGGKTRLAPFVRSLFRENDLIGCRYVEPYAGGAGIALSLLFEGYVSDITINDYDRSIYAFWHSITNENEKFCKKIEETPITIQQWYEQRETQAHKADADLFDLGFSTFYLNRTNVSGVIKGGVIGGQNQTGKWKMGDRFNKKRLIKRIEEIGEYRHKITVTKDDALNLIKKHRGDFFYIDPPYVNKAGQLYMSFYREKDHREIAKAILSNKRFRWLLSYDENTLIQEIYKSCKHRFSWSTGYGSSNRKGRESIFLHPELKTLESRGLLVPSSPSPQLKPPE